MNNEPIIIERVFDAKADVVWKAITNKDEMRKWYLKLNEFKPEVGFEFEFHEGENPNNLYHHICKVTEVIQGKKLVYTWRYGGFIGNSEVSFELYAEGDKTRLKLTHSGIESFPLSNPELSKAEHEKGWSHIIGVSLKEFLEKQLQ